MTDFAISFATPHAGWMRIDVRVGDYDGPGYASSDVRNDPYKEFQEVATALLNGTTYLSKEVLLWGEPEETLIQFNCAEGDDHVRITVVDDFDILATARTLPRKKVAEQIQQAAELVRSRVVP